jgi:nucleotide-binding universal stress UspA family protein
VFTRILVPLDGSEMAERALVHAAQMADIFDAELILLRAAFLVEVPGFDLDEVRPEKRSAAHQPGIRPPVHRFDRRSQRDPGDRHRWVARRAMP